MTFSADDDRTYLVELTALLSRFRDLVAAENAALERHDTSRLRHLTPTKIEAGKAFEAMWREFRSRLHVAEPEVRGTFAELAEAAYRLRPLIARNLALLNAAKVTTAQRVEAGLAAWRRSQDEKSPGYGGDGRASAGARGAALRPARLI